MNGLFNSRFLWFPAVLLVALVAVSPARSRTWSKNPINLAQDYLMISDNRGGGDLAAVLWLAPAMIQRNPATEPTRDRLDKFIVLGVAHAHMSKEGTMTFDKTTMLEADDANGNALTLLDTKTVPPAVAGALAVVQSIFTRSPGAFGQGMQWFVFNGGTVHACAKGGLAVQFAAEKYTYATPVPSCT